MVYVNKIVLDNSEKDRDFPNLISYVRAKEKVFVFGEVNKYSLRAFVQKICLMIKRIYFTLFFGRESVS